METFVELKKLEENPFFRAQRGKSLSDFSNDMIDEPIIDLITGFNRLPYCFTLQSCYGHFLYDGQEDPHNIEPLPLTDVIPRVAYKIAYVAFCIENSDAGRMLFEPLKEVTALDPENVQFCCAEWFWKKQVNSYVLQVEPDRFKHMDKATLDYEEALHIEKVRNRFFLQLNKLVHNETLKRKISCKQSSTLPSP